MKNRTNYVYLFTSPNRKNYIGISVEPEVRVKKHNRSSWNPKASDYNCTFHRAIRKYGIENFEYSILLTFTDMLSREAAEVYFIALHEGYTKGYNETKGGEGCAGREITQETKDKIQKSNLGQTRSKKARANMSKAATGRKHSTEMNLAQSKRLKGKTQGKEHIKNRAISRKNNAHTTEVYKKIGRALSKPVKAFDPYSRVFVAWYRSMTEASKDTGAQISKISDVVNGKRKTAGKYKWVFA